MKAKKLLIDVLDLDADTQSRVALSKETIAEYVEAIRDGVELPPIDVFFDGADYYIGDGWHRAYAWLAAQKINIPITMHNGGQRDALLFAAGANQGHGLKRTNADKRRAVEIMLRDAEWGEWSNVKIAEHCGVGDMLVADVRRQVPDSGTSEELDEEDDAKESDGEPTPSEPPKPVTRVGKDGKRYPVKEKPAPPKGPSIATLAMPYKRACNDLVRIKSDLNAIAKDEKEGAHLATKIVRITRDIDDLRGAINQSEPLELCGKCGGEGCQHCARTGFWTRMTVNSLKK